MLVLPRVSPKFGGACRRIHIQAVRLAQFSPPRHKALRKVSVFPSFPIRLPTPQAAHVYQRGRTSHGVVGVAVSLAVRYLTVSTLLIIVAASLGLDPIQTHDR